MIVTKNKPRSWGLQVNVLILFLVALGALISTALVVKENEKVLRQTVNDITKPDQELYILRDILTSLSGADNNLRFFALTDEDRYFDLYELLVDSIESNIKLLSNSFINDALTNRKLDSVTVLLGQRDQLITSYLENKNQRENMDYESLALKTINRSKLDTLINRRKTTTTTITFYDTLPVTEVLPEKDEKPKGIFRKLKKVFTKSNQDIVKIPDPVVRSTTQIKVDTSSVEPLDTTLVEEIGKELVRISNTKIRDYQIMMDKEFELLQNSSLTLNQIVEIFKRIEVSVVIKNKMQAKEARDQASRSLLVIGFVSLIAFILIFLLLIFIFNSIRKSNQYRQQLIFSNIQADQLAKVKEEFLANMSHEIRTPLNAIIGFSEQLSNTSLNGDQLKYIDAVRRSSKHLLETVNDILDLSRLVAGKLSLEKIKFNLNEVFDDVMPPFRIQAFEKGLKFITSCFLDKSLSFEGDPLRIRQILYNLLSNAIKFTEKGTISIKCESEVVDKIAKVKIHVEDTGIGIPEDKLDSVFQDFNQIDSSSARKYGGSGLGLAITRRLARLQNGDITVKSEPGIGSKFTLEINLTVFNPSDEVLYIKSEEGIPNLKGFRILVVDDDVFNILLAKIIAENNEMVVDVASDGFKAKEMIMNKKYDIIMTDLQMPGLTGSELIGFIRSHSNPDVSKLPVIAFTAAKIDRFDDNLLSLGFNEVLQKPFLESEFLLRIAFYLSDPSVIPIVIDRNNSMGKMYALDQVKLFAGNNEQEVQIIKTFISSANESVAHMWQCIENSDIVEIKNVAHRLLTSYGHFEVNSALDLLHELDQLDLEKVDSVDIKSKLNKLNLINRTLFESLEKEILRIK